jgi:hypothetical protein
MRPSSPRTVATAEVPARTPARAQSAAGHRTRMLLSAQ